ncbi:MAG TPA: metallophosphoesterase [Gammaproteobacteria bacterium]|nr:metallophosphoesterase [Gammaproteobacteria bacterium]
MNTEKLSGFSRWLAVLTIVTLAFSGLYGCSGSSSSSSEGDAELVISLTDAEGDFLSYTVDVLSLKMLKSNGAQVETLPLTTRLDFARYVEVTEFLTAATVPSGHYTGAQIVLDFSNAEIIVQDADGNPITATVQDADGNPVTQMTVDVTFNGESDFVIAPGIPAHITLDFDLDASNAVVVNGSDATVVVSPVLVADTLVEEPKPHRLRGLLAGVNQAEESFAVRMRPFRHRPARNETRRFGRLNVHVVERTVYEIDGRMYAGDEGLQQLAQLPLASAVVARGALDIGQRRFVAAEVYAGSSVPWGDRDIVSGNVIARSGDSITVRGATLVRANGSFAFNDNVTISLADTTTVVKQGDASNSHSIADISVGQRITALGRVTDNSTLAMDAAHVRMLYTNIGGTVVAAGPLAVDLQGIDLRRVSLFDFSGTGVDPASDADPDYYEVDTASLSLANLQLGDPVKVRGHVTPFGSAPEDFSAQTVLDAQNMRAQLVTGFGEGSVNAFADLSETGMLLDLNEAGERHHLYRAGISTDLLSLPASPLITPRTSGDNAGKGLFVISQGQAVRVYTRYSDFYTALSGLLDGNTPVLGVHASGRYDSNLNQLKAAKITVKLAR